MYTYSSPLDFWSANDNDRLQGSRKDLQAQRSFSRHLLSYLSEASSGHQSITIRINDEQILT